MTSEVDVRLARAAGYGRPPAPVRIVHLGVGNFFRAHQAWYTEHADDAADWGIAGFTGRSAAMVEAYTTERATISKMRRIGANQPCLRFNERDLRA